MVEGGRKSQLESMFLQSRGIQLLNCIRANITISDLQILLAKFCSLLSTYFEGNLSGLAIGTNQLKTN